MMDQTSRDKTFELNASSQGDAHLFQQTYPQMLPQSVASGISIPCTLSSAPVIQQASLHDQSPSSTAGQEHYGNSLARTSVVSSNNQPQQQHHHHHHPHYQPIYGQIYQSLQTYQQTQQPRPAYSQNYGPQLLQPQPPTSQPPLRVYSSYGENGGNQALQPATNGNTQNLPISAHLNRSSNAIKSPNTDSVITLDGHHDYSHHAYGCLSVSDLNNRQNQNRFLSGEYITPSQHPPRLSGAQKSINSMLASMNSHLPLERMLEKSSATMTSLLPVQFSNQGSNTYHDTNNGDTLKSNVYPVNNTGSQIQLWQPYRRQVYPDRSCNNEISFNSNNDLSTVRSVDHHRRLVDTHNDFTSGSSSTTVPKDSNMDNLSINAKTSPAKVASEVAPDGGGKFKSYLAHLVLASNVPFAYAIILVAFLITVIAATSIITILTIVLTITGYTAYPLTENTFNTSLVIGVVCASFALTLVTASLIVWRRHCQQAYYYLDDPQSASRGTNSPQLSETYDDTEYGSVPVNDWAKHVQKLHADGDIGFSREFGQIQASKSMNLTCEHSRMPENKHKNRYINIVAYDHTRVMLRQLPGQKKPGSDYINANFIDGYNKPRAYIGTQGPLVSTFDDYWRMIWEQRVVIIVMITNLQERGRRKCDMYWPKEGSETYGHIQVRLLQEVVMATYTLRTFTAKNLKLKKRLGSERTVYQYHYTNWPDHGVPDHPLPVLSFVRKSASANPPGAGAIICHCSAGCGRSGTYIVIDAMLKQIRHRQSINVVDFLKHIRNQRNYLVQTEEQYIFIHDALVEAIESGETEISSALIAKYIQLLQTGGQQAQLKTHSSSYSLSLVNATGGKSQLLGPVQQPALSVAAPDRNNNNQHGLDQLDGQQVQNRSQSAGSQWSLLERQYRLVASFKAKDFNVVSALKPANKNKNRTLNLIPLEAHRVHITPKPGLEGSDYINATFLMGFNHLREFIVTQHPVYDTYSDFWQMVYDHNSQTIVLLTETESNLSMPDQQEFGQFWPQKEDEVDYGAFKVKLISEQAVSMNKSASPDSHLNSSPGGLIVSRDFIMRSNQDDYELQTKLIHCPGWPEHCGPLASVFDLIQVVQSTTQQQASRQRMHDGNASSTTVTIGQEHEPQNGGPIIVVDKFGGTEAATFAVLTTLYKQINFEDAVDVYMYSKLAHLRRPGIWSSQDDYLFLYRAIENYASSQSEAAAAAAASQMGPSSPGGGPTSFSQTMTLDRHRHKQRSASGGLRGSSTMRRPAKALAEAQQRVSGRDLGSNSSNDLLLQLDHQQNQHQNQLQLQGTQKQAQLLAAIKQPARVKQQTLRPSIQQAAPILGTSPYSSAVSIGASPHQQLLVSPQGRPPPAQHLYPMG